MTISETMTPSEEVYDLIQGLCQPLQPVETKLELRLGPQNSVKSLCAINPTLHGCRLAYA